jgi:molybdopterin converting factor subunit 1
MTLRVLLFARYAELAGGPAIEVEVEEGVTLEQVWAAVRLRAPALRSDAEPLMAVDRTYARPEHVVRHGAEIAFFPPVSGG